MKKIITTLSCTLCLFALLNAQSDAGQVSLEPRRYLSPLEVSLEQEQAEVQYFTLNLSQLKEAYRAADMGKIAQHESAVLLALRREINQLELKIASETAQQARRQSATSGQITGGSSPDDAPRRDPLAEAVTPDEQRLETMQYTLAAFDRHAFDPADQAAATRDFAKLDKIQEIMETALAELLAIRNK